ncbi:glycosyltransferase [Myxococcota bacterium]|nr:glycosyltransferase [Myxococcota bacterium]
MRVLISASTFPLHSNDGLPRFVFDLAQGLSNHAQVTVLAPHAPGALHQERMADVDVQRFTYFLPRSLQALAYGHGIRDNLRASWWARLQPPGFILSQALATRRLADRLGAAVVNSHWIIPQGLSTALARGARRRFLHVLSVHAGDVYMLEALPFGSALARFVVSRSDEVMAVGTHVRDSLDALLGRPSGATLQPMGAGVRSFREGPVEASLGERFPQGYLLFLGRFSEKKGTVYLLRALPRVLQEYPGIGLVLIGYGVLEAPLRSEAAALGIEDSVVFAGRKTHEEIGGYLRGSRVAVVPSIVDSRGETEGMPTVVVEALASGARVVGSRVNGIPDVIRHRENGWLCEPKNPDDLAEKILMALAEPDDSPIWTQAASTADGLDWSAVAAHYARVFERLREGSPRTPTGSEGT